MSDETTWWRKVFGMNDPLTAEERQRLDAKWEQMMRSNKSVMQQRWRAFTTDELHAISEIVGTHIDARFWNIITEVEAELRRRKTGNPPPA